MGSTDESYPLTVSRGVTPLQQGCTKSCAVSICTQLHTVSKIFRGHVHHHFVLDCICQHSSRGAFPTLPRSQSLFKAFRVVTPRFRRHDDLLHQGILSIFECLARIDYVTVAMPLLHWSPQRIGPSFVHCLSLSRPMHNASAYNTSSVHRPALSRLPGRSDFARCRICPSTLERQHKRGSCVF